MNCDLSRFVASNSHYFYYPIEYAFEKIANAGYVNLEFLAGTPHFFTDAFEYSDCRKVAKLASDTGLTITALHPEMASRRYTLCQKDPSWRKLSLDFFRRSMDAARELGAGIVPIEAAGMLRDEPREEAFKRCAENLSALSGYAAESGLTLALENSGTTASDCVGSLEDVCEMLRQVKSPNLKAALSIPAMVESGETIHRWFEAIGNDIVFVHLNDGRPGGSYIWGEGILPLRRFLRQLEDERYEGPLGQYLDGSQYVDDPAQADALNLMELKCAAELESRSA